MPEQRSAEWHLREAEYWVDIAKENFHGGSGPHALEAARVCADIARAHAEVAKAIKVVQP